MVQPSDRVALVTGAARGIGEAISAGLAADGYAVAIGRLDETGAKAVGRSPGRRDRRAHPRGLAGRRRLGQRA